MSVTPRPPIPSLIPESAPFSPEQRNWLNGLFAGLFGLSEGVTPVSSADAAKLLGGLLDGNIAAAPTEADASGDSLATIGPSAAPAIKPEVHVASRAETHSESRSEARHNHHGGRARLGARLREHCGHRCGGHTIRTAHNR